MYIIFYSFSEFQHNFNGNEWATNGPAIITRVFQNICDTKNISQMNPESCQGMKVYSPNHFYAIPWRTWYWFFEPKYTKTVINVTENSPIIHVWNKLSKEKKMTIGSNTAYEVIAKKNCPNVYDTSEKYF